VSRVDVWPEISDYIGSKRGLDEWISVPIGSPWDGMKQLGSHTTTERTSKTQEQEFMMVLKRGGLPLAKQQFTRGRHVFLREGKVSLTERDQDGQ
jgi:hypothetical protein